MTVELSKLNRGPAGPRRFAAVDFDGRQLRVVHAERVGGRARILKLAAVAIPPGIDVASPADIGRILGGALKDMGLRNVGVLMNVTRAEAVLKPVTLPPGTARRELSAMVQFQVEKELPFRPEEAVIDFTIESHYDVSAPAGQEAPAAGVDVLVGAVRLPVVDQYRQIAEAAGVKLLRLGLRPYANARCVAACTRRGPNEAVLIVHFGADETEIDVLVGSALSFSRSVSARIAQAGSDPHKLAESVRTVTMEVVRSVQSYQAVERGFAIDSILVAGGTGVEAVAAEELSARLNAPCELFNPTAALGLGEVENPSAFISALGLAIGHAGADQLPFDFLNPKRPPVQRNWARTAGISAAALVLLGLGVGVTAGSIYLGGKAKGVDEIGAKVKEQEEHKRNLQAIKKRVEGISRWQGQRLDWLNHWAYLSSLFPSCTDAYIATLKSDAEGTLSFTVKARDSKILTDLSERLTEANYRFQFGRLATARDPFGYTYTADVRLFLHEDMPIDLASVKPNARPEDDDSLNQWGRAGEEAVAAAGGASGSPTGGGPGGSGSPGSSGSPSGSPSGTPQGPSPGGIDVATLEVIRRDLLSKYDQNHNGQLEREEQRSSVFFYLTKEHMKHFDKNQDGRLDQDEFRLAGDVMRQLFGTTGGPGGPSGAPPGGPPSGGGKWGGDRGGDRGDREREGGRKGR